MDMLAASMVNPRLRSRSSLLPGVPGIHELLGSNPPVNSLILRVEFDLNDLIMATHAIQQIGLFPCAISGTKKLTCPISSESVPFLTYGMRRNTQSAPRMIV